MGNEIPDQNTFRQAPVSENAGCSVRYASPGEGYNEQTPGLCL
jgi:hypothetical protein